MEKYIVTTGKTIELAIEAALAQLKLDRDSVSVEVLKNARSGFLGIGSSPAEVKVTYEVPDEDTAPKTALSSASRSKPKERPEIPVTTGVISRPGKKIEPEQKPAKKQPERKPEKKSEPRPEKKAEPRPEKKAEPRPEKKPERKPEAQPKPAEASKPARTYAPAEAGSVEEKIEKAMADFDYAANRFCLDTAPGRIMYFYYDPARYFKYIRPIKRK